MRIFNIIYRTADNTVAEANIAATSKGKATAVVGKVITCTDITADQFTNDTPDKVKEVLADNPELCEEIEAKIGEQVKEQGLENVLNKIGK